MCAHPRASTIPAAGVSESEDDRAIFAGRSQGLEALEGDSLEQRLTATRSEHQLLSVVADVRPDRVTHLVGGRLVSG